MSRVSVPPNNKSQIQATHRDRRSPSNLVWAQDQQSRSHTMSLTPLSLLRAFLSPRSDLPPHESPTISTVSSRVRAQIQSPLAQCSRRWNSTVSRRLITTCASSEPSGSTGPRSIDLPILVKAIVYASRLACSALAQQCLFRPDCPTCCQLVPSGDTAFDYRYLSQS